MYIYGRICAFNIIPLCEYFMDAFMHVYTFEDFMLVEKLDICFFIVTVISTYVCICVCVCVCKHMYTRTHMRCLQLAHGSMTCL